MKSLQTFTNVDATCGLTDGSTTVNPTGGNGVYTFDWDIPVVDPWDNTFDDAALQPGLGAGSYGVIVQDGLGCIDTSFAAISNSTGPTLTLDSSVNVTCNGLADGIIAVTGTGGTAPLVFTWERTIGAPTGPIVVADDTVANNLIAGTYQITVTDAGLCVDIITVVIAEPDVLSATGVVTDPLCFGGNGSIDVTTTGGNTPYTFDWDTDGYDDGEDTTAVAGTYDIWVLDSLGCTDTATFTINEPTQLTATTDSVESSCTLADGIAIVAPAGGTAGYAFDWQVAGGGPTLSNNDSLIDYPAGCYDVTITDGNLCTLDTTVCIVDAAAPSVAFALTHNDCNTDCDGAIDITISGGQAPYNTTWTSTCAGWTDPGTDDIFNLCACDYTLNVLDANNCSFNSTQTITEPTAIISNSVVTHNDCFEDSTGTIDITVSGGTPIVPAPDYTYAWSSGVFTSTAEDLTNLGAGSYDVTVTDDNGCTYDTTVVVNENPQIIITPGVVDALCGINDGSAGVTVTGGTGVYTYQWDAAGGNSTNDTIFNMGAGSYQIVVTDVPLGCQDSLTIAISNSNSPVVTLDSNYHISCNGADDGALYISATSTSMPLSYSWAVPVGETDPGDTNKVEGLMPGTYTLTTTDNAGCITVTVYTVLEPDALTLPGVVTDPNCFGENGSIDVTTTGGYAPYQYDWDNDGTLDFDDTEDLTIGDGTYTLDVIDSAGCTATAMFTITEPTQIVLTGSIIQSTCTQADGSAIVSAVGGTVGGDYTYNWYNPGVYGAPIGIDDTLALVSAGCYEVIVIDDNTCQDTLTVCPTDVNGPDVSETHVDATCDGDMNGSITTTIVDMGALGATPYVWTGPVGFVDPGTQNLTGIGAGSYNLIVTDTNNCTGGVAVTILDSVAITSTAVLSNPSCSYSTDGSIDLTPIDTVGGATYVWTSTAPGFVDPGTEDLTGLIGGQYCVTITDNNGCTLDTCFDINTPPAIVVTPTTTNSQCIVNTGSADVSATGGTGPYVFDWDILPEGYDGLFDDASLQTALGAGVYNVITLDQGTGCVDTTAVTVNNINSPDIDITSITNVTCNGADDGAIFVTVTGGTPFVPAPDYVYSWSSTVGGFVDPATEDLSSLAPGTYTITVTDDAGCQSTEDTTITEPLVLDVVQDSVDNVLCNGDNTGAAYVTVTGGTGTMDYAWDTDPSTGVFSTLEDPGNLTAGDYEVIVTDDNGCQDSVTVTITEPTAITFVTDSINSSCGNSDGEVSVVVSGGTTTGSYLYNWSPVAGAGATLSGIPAGCYQVVVTDMAFCQDSVTICISDTNGPAIVDSVVAVDCFGDSDGEIYLSGTGVPTITYNWTTGGFADPTEDTIIGVAAGTYNVIATDGNGCQTSLDVTVPGPTADMLATATIGDLTCYNDSSGSITVVMSGGTTPYASTDWTGPNGFTSSVLNIGSLIDVGTYQLDIVDANGCTFDTTFTLAQPDSIQNTITPTQPTCGASDGLLAVTSTGGDGNYTYTWDDLGDVVDPIPANDTAFNLPAGNYEVTATDGNGCTTTEVISLSDGAAPTITGTATDVTCNADADGTINITVSGTDNVFAWTTADGSGLVATDQNQTGLTAGTYNVSVTDTTNGCVATGSFTVNEPAVLTIVEDSLTHVFCNGDTTGAAYFTVSGGNGGYTYSWNSGAFGSTEDSVNIYAGNWTLDVQDALGCSQGYAFTINENAAMVVAPIVTDVNCAGDASGAIDINVTNGDTPYTYSWTSAVGGFVPTANEDLTGLEAGAYDLTVTDSSGCTLDTTINVVENSDLVFNGAIVPATCGLSDGEASIAPTGGTPFTVGEPYTYLWSNTGTSTNDTITGEPAGSYTVQVTDSFCTYDTTIVITNPGAPTIVFDSIWDVTCFGGSNGAAFATVSGGSGDFSYVWNPNAISLTEDLMNQPAGTYTLEVTDNITTCVTIADTIIGTNSQVGGTVTVTDATCGVDDGSVSIAGSGGSGNYTYTWPDASTGSTWSGLGAGSYTLTVTDDSSCTENVNFSVNSIGGPTDINATTTNPVCGGDCDGTISVTPVGGTAPYTYYWPTIPSVSDNVSGLCAGDYDIQVTDSNGCTYTETVTITEPTALSATAVIDPATCGATDGTITVTVTGGTGLISHSWSTGGSNFVETPLAEGNYTDTITDGNGCTLVQGFFVPGDNAPDIVLTAIDAPCHGDCLGAFTSVTTGAIGAMSYQWFDNAGNPLTGETADNIDTLCAGDYVLQGTDAGTGCIAYGYGTIGEPDTMVVQFANIVDASCAVSCDGSVTALPLGGTLPYSYAWSTVGDTTQNADSLCSGIVQVTVTDANGCIVQQNLNIGETNLLDATVASTDATCGECNGDATVTAINGSGSYTYTWNIGTGDTQDSLCAGVYTVQVTDDNGCEIDVDVPISNTGGPTGETVTQTDVTCYGDSTGSVTVVPQGGQTPYSYLWFPGGQNTNTLTNIPAGNYNLQVTDDNGCSRVVPVTITENDELDIDINAVDASCGNNDGSIIAIATGGTAPYTYTWLSYPGAAPSGNPVSGLEPGTYVLEVCDATGCCTTETIAIANTNGPQLEMTYTNVNCYGVCDGTASVNVLTGSGGYDYDWINTGGTAATDNGLCVGQHIVEVTDQATGCMSIGTVTISQPDSLSVSIPVVTDASCNGICDGSAAAATAGGHVNYTYDWSHDATIDGDFADSLCAGTISVTITDLNGCSVTQSFTIDQPDSVLVSIDTIINATCPQSNDGEIQVSITGGDSTYTYDWDTDVTGDFDDTEDLDSLFGGVYILVVQDGNGCLGTDTMTVDTNTVVIATLGADTAYCSEDCIVLIGSATGSSNLSFAWTDQYNNVLGTNDSITICNDTVGLHEYVFTASEGVCIDSDSINVTVNEIPEADAGDDLADFINAPGTLGGNPTGPAGATYVWSPTTDFTNPSDSTEANPDISIATSGDYIVQVTSADGCINYDTVTVEAWPFIDFGNGITPNADGVNDTWNIANIENYPDAVVEVYNRWGQQLFISVGYTQQFDGTYQGKDLPVGTYYYIITLNHPDFPDAITGPITIMR